MARTGRPVARHRARSRTGRGELVVGRTEWARVMGEKLGDSEATVAVLEPLVQQEALDTASADLLMAAYAQLQNVAASCSRRQLWGQTRTVRSKSSTDGVICGGTSRPERARRGHSPPQGEPGSNSDGPATELIALYREAAMVSACSMNWTLPGGWTHPMIAFTFFGRERRFFTENTESIADAVMAWEELLERVPDDRDALTGLLFLYGQQHRHDDVRRVIESCWS